MMYKSVWMNSYLAVITAGLGRGAVVEASPEQATGANARVL